MIVPPRPALAADRVRHVGDPVAFVVADTASRRATPPSGSRSTTGRCLPSSMRRRRSRPARRSSGTRRRAICPIASRGATERRSQAAFAGAAHVVEIELVNNRLVVAPIEPRAAIGSYDAATGRFDLLLTGPGRAQHPQSSSPMRCSTCRAERIRVAAPDVGGGFGVKNFLYPEWVLVLWAARELGRPVQMGRRARARNSSPPRRAATTSRARGSRSTRTGRFLALDVATVANLGAYLSTNGPGSSTNSPASAMGGVYAIPAIFMDVRGAFTNTVPIDAYRGAGKPEANYLIERLIDVAARRSASIRSSCAGAT